MTTIKSYILIFALFAPSVFFNHIAMAQSNNSQKLYDSLTMKQIFDIMQKNGYDVELIGLDAAINWTIYGDVVSITIDNPNQINFYTFVSHSDVIRKSIYDSNKWNTEYRYSKMYVDRKENVVLELDFDLTGGVTEERIIGYFNTCFISYNTWLKYIYDK